MLLHVIWCWANHNLLFLDMILLDLLMIKLANLG